MLTSKCERSVYILLVNQDKTGPDNLLYKDSLTKSGSWPVIVKVHKRHKTQEQAII